MGFVFWQVYYENDMYGQEKDNEVYLNKEHKTIRTSGIYLIDR